jgi:hypothetical protein
MVTALPRGMTGPSAQCAFLFASLCLCVNQKALKRDARDRPLQKEKGRLAATL